MIDCPLRGSAARHPKKGSHLMALRRPARRRTYESSGNRIGHPSAADRSIAKHTSWVLIASSRLTSG
jgi:hypothetical protein